MQNLSTVHRQEIRDRNEILVPAGRGKTSFVDCRDIAEVGAMALLEPGHEGKAYDLTGAQALDYQEVASLFTEVLGRQIDLRPDLGGSVRRHAATLGNEAGNGGGDVPAVLVDPVGTGRPDLARPATITGPPVDKPATILVDHRRCAG